MSSPREFVVSLTLLGTDAVDSTAARLSIQLLNGLALLGIAATALALLDILATGQLAALPVNLGTQAVLVLVLWLNHKHRFRCQPRSWWWVPNGAHNCGSFRSC